MTANSLNAMFERSIYQNNPINALVDFLEQEKRHEVAREINKMRFVGYVLELGFESAKIITSDTYKIMSEGYHVVHF